MFVLKCAHICYVCLFAFYMFSFIWFLSFFFYHTNFSYWLTESLYLLKILNRSFTCDTGCEVPAFFSFSYFIFDFPSCILIIIALCCQTSHFYSLCIFIFGVSPEKIILYHSNNNKNISKSFFLIIMVFYFTFYKYSCFNFDSYWTHFGQIENKAYNF